MPKWKEEGEQKSKDGSHLSHSSHHSVKLSQAAWIEGKLLMPRDGSCFPQSIDQWLEQLMISDLPPILLGCSPFIGAGQFVNVLKNLVTNRILRIDDNHSVRVAGALETLSPQWKYVPSGYKAPLTKWPSNFYYLKPENQLGMKEVLL